MMQAQEGGATPVGPLDVLCQAVWKERRANAVTADESHARIIDRKQTTNVQQHWVLARDHDSIARFRKKEGEAKHTIISALQMLPGSSVTAQRLPAALEEEMNFGPSHPNPDQSQQQQNRWQARHQALVIGQHFLGPRTFQTSHSRGASPPHRPSFVNILRRGHLQQAHDTPTT